MLRSDNAVDGPISSHINLTQTKSGEWQAVCPGHEAIVPAVVRKTEFEAIQQIKMDLEAAVSEGKI